MATDQGGKALTGPSLRRNVGVEALGRASLSNGSCRGGRQQLTKDRAPSVRVCPETKQAQAFRIAKRAPGTQSWVSIERP
jgi:hypothetical protein